MGEPVRGRRRERRYPAAGAAPGPRSRWVPRPALQKHVLPV